MRYKRDGRVLVSALWFLSLPLTSVACGGGSLEEQAQTPTGVVDDVTTMDVAEIDDPWLCENVSEWTGNFDGMVERGFIRLLTPYSKTLYFLDGARERGVNADMSRVLQDYLNGRLKKEGQRIEVVVIPVRRDQLIPYLIKGYGDMAVGGLTITEERLEKVDFSNASIKEVKELVVTSPSAPKPVSVEDLGGMEIWVRASSSYYESLRNLNKKLHVAGKPQVNIRKADEYLEDEALLEMVNSDLLPATIVDSYKLEWIWSKVFDKCTIHQDVVVRAQGQLAAAVRKDSEKLIGILNDFYKAHGVGTLIGNTVIKRYFKNLKWVTNVNATSERKRFEAVVDHFRKYATENEFDYLMLVAQGYQESRLDQRVRSPVGAIGVMQLMPETAAGSPVFIPNVEEIEPNIRAGIKYMRYILDNYFDDAEIDEVNKHLFAFAAYNAGPNRIARLRKKATEYGFNPNEWFDNVERVVARKVGQEPVSLR